jgi:hypothetical protein
VRDEEWQMIDVLAQHSLVQNSPFTPKISDDLKAIVPKTGEAANGDNDLIARVMAEHVGITGNLKRDKNIQIEWTHGLENFTVRHKQLNSKIVFRTIPSNPTIYDFASIQSDFKQTPDIGSLLYPTSAFNPDIDEDPKDLLTKNSGKDNDGMLPYTLHYKLSQESLKEYIEIFVLNKEINEFHEGLLFEKYKNKRANFNFEGNVLLSYAVDGKGLEKGNIYLADIYHEEMLRLLNDKLTLDDSIRVWEQMRLFNLLEAGRVTHEALAKGCFNCGTDLSISNIDKAIDMSERLTFMTKDSHFPTKFKSDLMGSLALEAFLKNRGKTVYAVVEEMFIEQTLKKFLTGLEQVRITSDYSFKFARNKWIDSQIHKHQEVDASMMEEDEQMVHKNIIFQAMFGTDIEFDTEDKRMYYEQKKAMYPNYSADQLLENWIVDSQDKKAYNAILQSDRCGAVNLLFKQMDMMDEEKHQANKEEVKGLTYAEARAETAKMAEAKLSAAKAPVNNPIGGSGVEPREAVQQKKLTLKANAPSNANSSSKKKKK